MAQTDEVMQDRARRGLLNLMAYSFREVDLARLLNVSQPFVSHMATGRTKVPRTMIVKLAWLAPPRPDCAVPRCQRTSEPNSQVCGRHCQCMVGEPCPDDVKPSAPGD